MSSPWTDGTNACIPIFIITRGVFDLPEIGIVACKSLLHRILTNDGMRVTEDITDVVTGPIADWVRFEDCSTIFCRVGLFADADLAVPLAEFHAAFCCAVAAGHDSAVAVCFIEWDFIAGPVDYSVGGGGFG